MGNRYYLTVNCPYCGKQKDDFYYAPTCGFITLSCDGCKKTSVMIDMALTKVEDATAEQMTDNEINELNMWTPNKEQEREMLEENRNMIESWRKLNERVIPQKPLWVRYRFYTKSVDDYRPIIFNKHYPWWCSGEAGDGSYAIIIAYLPKGEDLKKYWDDAYEVDENECSEITFTDRFPKPDWFLSV